MQLKPNKPFNYTTQINDTFYNLSLEEMTNDWSLFDLLKLEAALNFKLTTDFQTMAEVVPYIKGVDNRYNYQIAIARCMRLVVNLN